MGFGEIIPHAGMRYCYKMQNVNDSSGNGRTLTNAAGVTFDAGKFGLGANFGTSGTSRVLRLSANPMSGLTYANATWSMWVKLNTTADVGTARYIFDSVTSLINGPLAARTFFRYTIASGIVTLRLVTKLVVTDADISYNINASTTQWFHLVAVKSGTTTLTLYVNGVQVATNTGSGGDLININPSYYLAVGNITSAVNLQGWITINEFICEERAWTASEIRKKYSQGRGFNVAQ